MKIADLYIRVSTDEQADKGYSQRSQDDVLRKYCEINNIKVRRSIFEDHSAKTFERPEWKKLLLDLKKHKGKTDLILFTKWDRFSRNASDAYYMISVLRKLGIEPIAIEQPLDTTVPENKMMLAVYLTAPEIENDRRALNTFYGIRQAKKEGRWMGIAPIGYKNKIQESGRKYIGLVEPEATLMKWAFEQIGGGFFSAEATLKTVREKGLICSKNNFLTAVRNPCYMGKIRLAKFKDEEARFVDGLHESLISESLFYKVQDALDGRKKQYGQPMYVPEMLPLRGFLQCPKCTRLLTGSASKGRNDYFYYYHCSSACGIRYRAGDVNDAFLTELKKFVPKPGIAELYTQVVLDGYQDASRFTVDARKKLITQITDQNTRLGKARELLLLNDIDPEDYKIIKKECEARITRLEAELNELATSVTPKIDLPSIVEKAVSNMINLDSIYLKADISKKREIIGSMFREKLCFDGTQHRTGRPNDAASLIYLINNKLIGKKNGAKSVFSDLPHEG
jgi:DNA invertase Pin-like site-specific DNA recombinase